MYLRAISVLTVFALLGLSNAMECYVCHNQEGNEHKCKHSLMTCPQEKDMCMTEIRWGTTPYWQAGAQKQYYISKKCATKQQCERTMKKFMSYCTHVWYEDWRCSECCAGDRCNYYIISSAGTPLVNWFLTSCLALLSMQSLTR